MASGSTLTTFDAALKDYYTDEKVESMVYEDNPFLGIIGKVEKFPGRKMVVPIIYGNSVARSADFDTAQGLGDEEYERIEAFELTRVKDYGFVTIDTELIEASEGDEAAFFEAQTNAVDGIINALTRSLAIGAFRAGWGRVGSIGSSSSATVTLAVASDAHNFEKGMRVQFAESESGHVLRDSGQALTVLSVNRNAGTVTFTENVSEIASVANGDVMFAQGDRQNSATPTRRKVAGLEAWCPATAPSASENFFGVDRSVDTRLYGTSYNGASDDIEDALVEGLSRAAALGYGQDYGFISHPKFAALTKRLHDLARYIDVKPNEEATYSYRGVTVNGSRGPVKVLPDQNCPSNRCFMLNTKFVKLYSLKKAIRVFNSDGLSMLRQATSDGVEIRYGFKGNIGCRAPASLVNIQL